MEKEIVTLVFAGSLAILSSGFLPGKASRYASTALSSAVMLALLYISLGNPGLAGYVGFVSSVIGLAAVISGLDLVEESKPLHDALVTVLTASLPLLLLLGDLLRLFVAWETISVCILALTAFHRDRESAEAAVKYIMLCGVASLLALAGIALSYLETGSLSVESFAKASLAAKMLVVVGFGAEAAVFPLHFWLPDAHMVAPSTASAVLSGITIEAAGLLVYRLVGSEPILLRLLSVLAVAGALLGNFSAYRQVDVKRLLAYSSVANVGYIFLGLTSGNATARTAAYLHVAGHGFLKAALFILSGVLLADFGSRRLDKLQGSLSGSKVLKAVLVVAALGLTGAPLALTFWSELYIIVGVAQSSLLLALLALTAVIASFGYYFNLVYALCVGEGSRPSGKPRLAAELSIVGLVALSASLLVLYGWIAGYFAL
ncbi:complex I subunit 5 family protein [Thermofilum pendens]|uniref:NADH dehydrogenase (Quinone) n=1 Tax=Thermofilum pendens (strain DSM 2475 / Hrk 5) TaxID=368408 RepID=A1RZ46_THEPD|nr:proton-conducting transporter membrane subunit [Thermofilum pendens]ABL78476.1 NADH dehydrogenase (quinone) [Thermofilum pendens Hrk 5]